MRWPRPCFQRSRDGCSSPWRRSIASITLSAGSASLENIRVAFERRKKPNTKPDKNKEKNKTRQTCRHPSCTLVAMETGGNISTDDGPEANDAQRPRLRQKKGRVKKV